MLDSEDSGSPGASSLEISTSSGSECCSTLTEGKVLLFRQLSEVLLKQLISRTLTAEHSSADVQLDFYNYISRAFCTKVLTLGILDRFPFNGTLLSRFVVSLNFGFVRSFL